MRGVIDACEHPPRGATRSLSSPLQCSAQECVYYGSLAALVRRSQLRKLGAAVSQILTVLGEAVDGIVAYLLAWQPDLTCAVAHGQGLKESGSGDAPYLYDFPVPTSNPDCAHFQQVPYVHEGSANFYFA